jgi:hypothetical protein
MTKEELAKKAQDNNLFAQHESLLACEDGNIWEPRYTNEAHSWAAKKRMPLHSITVADVPTNADNASAKAKKGNANAVADTNIDNAQNANA